MGKLDTVFSIDDRTTPSDSASGVRACLFSADLTRLKPLTQFDNSVELAYCTKKRRGIDGGG